MAASQGQPAPLTVSSPPPHPTMAVFRCLKQSFRDYHSGAGATMTVANPATQSRTAPLTISGTIDVDYSVLILPPAVSVSVGLTGTGVVTTRDAPVTAGNPGTYTTTFPPNTISAPGGATATVSSIVPQKTATTSTFFLTI